MRMGWSRSSRQQANKWGRARTYLACSLHFHLFGRPHSPLWVMQEHTSMHAPAPSLLGTNRYRFLTLRHQEKGGLGESTLPSLGTSSTFLERQKASGFPLHCRKQSSRQKREGLKVKWQAKVRAPTKARSSPTMLLLSQPGLAHRGPPFSLSHWEGGCQYCSAFPR